MQILLLRSFATAANMVLIVSFAVLLPLEQDFTQDFVIRSSKSLFTSHYVKDNFIN